MPRGHPKMPRKKRCCSIVLCTTKYYARGYCQRHYRNISWYPKIKKELAKYRKDRRVRLGLNKMHKCDVTKCSKMVYSFNRFCAVHKYKFKKYGNPTEPSHISDCGVRGEKNDRWRGGVSYYPNHYLLKKNRIIKLQQTKGRCEVCNKKGYIVRHKDGSRTNHSLDNLLLLCSKCREIICRGRGVSTSKYIRIYGMPLRDISKKLNKSMSSISNLHNRGKLKSIKIT